VPPVTELFTGLEGSVNGTLCCDHCTTTYYFTVDSAHDNVTYILNRTKAVCSLDFDSFVDLSMNCSAKITMCIRLPVLWNKQLENCNDDIGHVASSYSCPQCDLLVYVDAVPQGLTCQLSNTYCYTTPGYWFDNGFHCYAIPCPNGHRNSLQLSIDHFNEQYPNSDYHCNGLWTGLACGECRCENCSILYDTGHCVDSHECLLPHLLHNVLILISTTLLYCFLIISVICVLLHIQFDVTAYGVIFYYSVLEE